MASRGRAIVNETTKLTQDMESGIYTHGAPANLGNISTASYPRGGLQARDARDELISEKAQFMKQAGGTGMTPFGQVVATDRDFEWLRKKRETEAFANLDAWIGENFHKADPATRKWLQETYPEYYESRERLMVDRAKLALRIKLLKLRGPKNEKDLLLQWALQTGRIKLDRDWDRVGPSTDTGPYDAAEERKRYKDGLFSIRRYLGESEREDNASRSDNPFRPISTDMSGFQGANFGFPGETVPVGNSRYPSFLQNVVSPYL